MVFLHLSIIKMKNFVFFHLFFFIGIQIASTSNDHEASTSRGSSRSSPRHSIEMSRHEIEEIEEEVVDHLSPHPSLSRSTSNSSIVSTSSHLPSEVAQWRRETAQRLIRARDILIVIQRNLAADEFMQEDTRQERLRATITALRKYLAGFMIWIGLKYLTQDIP